MERVLEDLEIAVDGLKRYSLSLVVVKEGKILFKGYGKGVKEMINAIDLLGDLMKDSSVADKVMGKACALLSSYAGVKAVYAKTISEAAIAVLEENGIYTVFDERVEKILDPSKARICPFEGLVIDIDDPVEAYSKLTAKIQ